MSVITIGEIRKGLTRLPKSNKKKRLTIWLNTLLEDYKERILLIDLTVAENWGIMQGNAEKEGSPMPTIDGLLAATANTYNLTIATRNESDFIQISTINPWV